eukprot:2276970-Prymnesium_polylepis.2
MPTLRSGRPCSLRDSSGGRGKDSSQGGGTSHAPALRQSLRPENAPVRGLSKVTANNVFAVCEDRARARLECSGSKSYMTEPIGALSHAPGRPPGSFFLNGHACHE